MKKYLSLADLLKTINVYEDEERLGILSGANEEVIELDRDLAASIVFDQQ